MVVTNTIPHEIQKLQCPQIKTVDISMILSEAIHWIQNGDSMSYLFRNIGLDYWTAFLSETSKGQTGNVRSTRRDHAWFCVFPRGHVCFVPFLLITVKIDQLFMLIGVFVRFWGTFYKNKYKNYDSGWCGSEVECQPVNQRVTGLIPSLVHMAGLQAGSPVGECKRQPHTDVSLLLFLPPFPFSKK